MAAERDDNAQNSSRWRPLAAGLALAALLTAGLVWLTHSDAMPIRELRIVGSFAHVSADQVRDEVSPRIDGNFFAVDVARIHDAVQGLNWVDEVWVDRIWPDVLQVRLKEQHAVALWGHEGVVNERGDLFSVEQPAGLARLDGPLENRRLLVSTYRDYSARLAPLALQISQLSLDARGSWQLNLADGPAVVLGRDEVQARFDRLLRFWPRLSSQAKTVERIDMRYANGFAVRFANKTGRRDTGTNVGVV